MKTKKQTAVEILAERISELEADNKKLQQGAPFVQREGDADDDLDPRNAAAQARITQRKNNTPDLVQLTAKGNVRTTFDPSDQFVSEQATSGLYDADADAAMVEDQKVKS